MLKNKPLLISLSVVGVVVLTAMLLVATVPYPTYGSPDYKSPSQVLVVILMALLALEGLFCCLVLPLLAMRWLVSRDPRDVRDLKKEQQSNCKLP